MWDLLSNLIRTSNPASPSSPVKCAERDKLSGSGCSQLPQLHVLLSHSRKVASLVARLASLNRLYRCGLFRLKFALIIDFIHPKGDTGVIFVSKATRQHRVIMASMGSAIGGQPNTTVNATEGTAEDRA